MSASPQSQVSDIVTLWEAGLITRTEAREMASLALGIPFTEWDVPEPSAP